MIKVYQNVNPTKLHGELVGEGVTPKFVLSDCVPGAYMAENTWITFDDAADEAAIEAVVLAHDPTPTPTQDTAAAAALAEIGKATTIASLRSAMINYIDVVGIG